MVLSGWKAVVILFVVFLCKLNPGLRLLEKKEESPKSDLKELNKKWKESVIKDHEMKKKVRKPMEVPLFIIAGTQKSGSTVLAAYLAHHANISFAKRKELHFFDKSANYEKGVEGYYKEFKISRSTIVMGEATPFYMASRKACKRIVKHFPDVKMIVILREPISRAYSEYQMKVRRIQEQTMFFQLVRRHQPEILSCLWQFPRNYNEIKSCLPSEVTIHGRYPKFTKALRKLYDNLKNWKKSVEECFPRKSETIIRRFLPFSVAASRLSLLNSNDHINKTSLSYLSSLGSSEKVEFNPKSCWKYYPEGYEAVNSIENAFIKEIEEFKNCSIKRTSSFFNYNPFHSEPDPSSERLSIRNNLEKLDGDIEECIPVQGGISRQYFYRSLYVAQFYHCFKSIDSNQFLVIGNKELRNNAVDVVKRVCAFLNIPSNAVEEIVKEQQIEEMVVSKFPSKRGL
jgi:hypothetical protein